MIDDLRVRRGRHDVLRDLALEIPRGSLVGLLGPSGSGKTTLMRSIVGVQTGVRGTVQVLGMPAGARPLRHLVGYVTQAPSVYPDLTVRQNLRYFAAVLGAHQHHVQRALDTTDLTSKADALVASLSGGQLSRVSLAAALVGSPELLVLDEPTVGLDPVLRADLWATFRTLSQQGTTLLVSSHVMDEANRCDRLLLLRNGALLADTTPAALLAQTGREHAEDAFLELIERARSSDPEPHDAHPRHRREIS